MHQFFVARLYRVQVDALERLVVFESLHEGVFGVEVVIEEIHYHSSCAALKASNRLGEGRLLFPDSIPTDAS